MNSADTAKIASNLKGLFFTKYLWGGYFVIFLILGSILAASAWYGEKHLEESAQAETHSIAVALDELNRRQIQTMTIPMEYVVSQVRKKGGIEKMSVQSFAAVFNNVKADMPSSDIRDIFAIDKEGFVLSTTKVKKSGSQKTNYRGHPDFEYAKKQMNPVVITSVVSSVDGKNVLVLMRTLRSSNGRFAGIVGVTRTFDDFESFYQSLDLHFPITFAMVREDGKILYHYPKDDLTLGAQVRFTRELEPNSEGSMNIQNEVDGGKKVGYFKFASNYSTMIFVGYDGSSAFANWRSVLKSGVLLFFLFMLSMAVLVRSAQKRQQWVEHLVEEFRRRDEMVRQIQKPTEMLTGNSFLKELLVQICKVFDVENGFIGLILPEHTDTAKCVVHIVDGEFVAEQEYQLRFTPFYGLKPGEFIVHSKSTSNIYPDDPLLGHRNIESSIGVTLQNSQREAIGILMIYSKDEMPELNMKRAILSVFASRAGAELVRIRTDEVRKEVEVLRKQIEERSLDSKKMEAIGTLAAGLVHDFNHIIAIILASIEKLFSFHKESAQDKHYLEAMKTACYRARHLVSQISVFNQGEDSATQVPVVLRPLFSEAKEFLKSTLPENIHLELDFGECGDLKISADSSQLQQAIMNLCLNAAKGIGFHGGEIRVTLQKNRIKDHLYVKCIVHHSGEELDREEIEKVFNPFYAENIAMVVVQRIISNHHGFIEIKSASGQGTDYEVFLPVLVTEVPAEAQKMVQMKTQKMVLIVDDEPEIGLLIKELLEIEGLQVQAETDPLKALRILKQHPCRFFMVISDLAMPEMSGFEFCRQVRELYPEMPLILWSGYYQYLDQELQNLNVKVLSKPIDAKKLLQMIHTEVSQLATQDTSKEVAVLGNAP
jgi:signal transduction histidine kinase/ActR/RegA family two-component response regulator